MLLDAGGSANPLTAAGVAFSGEMAPHTATNCRSHGLDVWGRIAARRNQRESIARSWCAVREPGDSRTALRRANHNHHTANNVVFIHNEHNGDATGDAWYAAVNDKFVKHHKHDANTRGRLANHHYLVEHDHDAGQLPHAARRWRILFMPERADDHGHRAEPYVHGERLDRAHAGVAAERARRRSIRFG